MKRFFLFIKTTTNSTINSNVDEGLRVISFISFFPNHPGKPDLKSIRVILYVYCYVYIYFEFNKRTKM